MRINNKKLLFVLWLLLTPWVVDAQNITIGDITTGPVSYNIPFNHYYNYSFVEEIYTSDEIQQAGGGAGNITSISFYRKIYSNDQKPTQALSHNIVLYMKNVSQATFPDNMNYVQVTTDDIVYEGTFDIPTTEGWITITLDTPFDYDVTKNLLIAIDENTRNYTTRYFSCTIKQKTVHSFYADNYNPNPYNLSSFINGTQTFFNGRHNDVMEFRANIQLNIVPKGTNSCTKPASLECTEATVSSATLNWAGGSGHYNVEYKKVSDPFWTTVLVNTDRQNLTLNNLEEDVAYQAHVQSICDGNMFSDWQVVDFHTVCGSVTDFPWAEDFEGLFEGEIPGCWDNSEGTTAHIGVDMRPTNHYWCFTNGQQGNGNSNGTGHNDSKCVRFDSFYNAIGRTNFLKTPVFDFPDNTLMLLDFWYKNPTGSDLTVYISTDGGETYPDILFTSLTDQPEWTQVHIELNDYVGAQNVVFVFGGTSNYELGDSYIYLDDVTVKGFTLTKDIAHYTEGRNDHYHLIASPIQAVKPEQVSGLLDNKFDLYYFDQTQPLEWMNYWSNEFSLVPGKGYLYANSDDVTLTFVGQPYRGDGKVTLVKSDDYKFPGINLVGNPFSDTAYVDRDFYVLNADGTELEAANRNYVEALEGIFVMAADDGEVLTFSREAPAKGAKLTLNLSGPSTGSGTAVIDRAMVRFDESGPLPKFQIGNHSTKLYITQDNIDYAVVRSEGKGELPVSLKAENDGIYTLSFSSEGIDFAYLHLIDHMTGADIDLLALRQTQGPAEYSFECQAGDYKSRFMIVFEVK